VFQMRILIATDGSQSSSAGLRFAGRLAGSRQDVELIVITVGALHRELFVSHPVQTSTRLEPEIAREEHEIASRSLSTAERVLRRHRQHCRFRFVRPRRHGLVAETIAQEADRERADLIIVGTDRFGAFASWALGSVSARLLQISRRPVTVVHLARRRRAAHGRNASGRKGPVRRMHQANLERGG